MVSFINLSRYVSLELFFTVILISALGELQQMHFSMKELNFIFFNAIAYDCLNPPNMSSAKRL